MKLKLSILFLSALFSLRSLGQDSVRTKNDRPGTPQSLRTIDNSPTNKVHMTNTHRVPNQTINDGATESNKVNNTNSQTIVADPNAGNGAVVPKTPITIARQPARPVSRTDSIINNGTMSNGQNNATNPIRK